MNRFQFKLFLAAFMVLDHTDFLVSGDVGIWIHILTRFVAVGFAYLAVEGFFYTKNITKYILRLYLAAGLMFLGNSFINLILHNPQVVVSNNIFLTLALGVTMLWLCREIESKTIKIIMTVSVLLLGFIFTEGGDVVLPFMLITYLNFQNPLHRDLWYLALSAFLFIIIIGLPSFPSQENLSTLILLNPDFCFITIIPLLSLYNGQQGLKNKLSQYFFYIFYPAHLWILAVIHYLLIES
ncbi:TraX family protein [Streptococcus ferus]|uniref:TraX family protein n=1 Tax=Streptococcus ferus TaxID=1345 RepID=UPI0035A1C25C